jgi:hypothetical protein
VAVIACLSLAAAGLLLGGYPGAVLLPVVTGLLSFPPRGWQGRGWQDWSASRRPLLVGGLFAVASVIGAVGEHLLYSGDGGPLVTATVGLIPQVICLLVIGGLAAACLDSYLDNYPG